MNKRTKNIIIILLLLLVNVLGYFVANSYFNPSANESCQLSKDVFSNFFGAKASLEETAKWINSLAELMKIFKGA